MKKHQSALPDKQWPDQEKLVAWVHRNTGRNVRFGSTADSDRFGVYHGKRNVPRSVL